MRKQQNNILHNTWVRIILVLFGLTVMLMIAHTNLFYSLAPTIQVTYVVGLKMALGATIGFAVAKKLFHHKVNWSKPISQISMAGIARLLFALFFAYYTVNFIAEPFVGEENETTSVSIPHSN